MVHHLLSTYYIHKDILNMPNYRTPDFEATPSRVHSLTTPACLAWVGWPRSKDPEAENPKKKPAVMAPRQMVGLTLE